MPSGNRGKSFTRSTVRRESSLVRAAIPYVARMALVWLRRDLRVHDHPPLRAALGRARARRPGVRARRAAARGASPSAPRSRSCSSCLRELRDALRARGGELFVARRAGGRAPRSCARDRLATPSTTRPDVSPFAVARDRAWMPRSMPVRVRPRPSSPTARHRRDRASRTSVFTPFWRAWARVPRRGVHGAPRRVPCRPELAAGRSPSVAPELPDPLPAGETAARARMYAWIADGVDLRRPPRPRSRAARPRSRPICTSAASARPSSSSGRAERPPSRASSRWRDFYAHVLLHHPANARRASRPELDAIEWKDDEEDFDSVEGGRTGFPSSTPGCASWRPRAGCTTARG